MGNDSVLGFLMVHDEDASLQHLSSKADLGKATVLEFLKNDPICDEMTANLPGELLARLGLPVRRNGTK